MLTAHDERRGPKPSNKEGLFFITMCLNLLVSKFNPR